MKSRRRSAPARTPARRGSARTSATRETVRVGGTKVNASDLKGLRYAWKHRRLSLFLGAGVSIPYGLPSWKDLVLELLFEQATKTRRLGGMWPHYRRAVASWMTDYFDYDPLVLARMVERDLGPTFLTQLRTQMYARYRKPAARTVLDAVVDLIATKKSGVDTVVTFNFDDLLEDALRKRKVDVQSVSSRTRQQGSALRVIHAHGFVPRTGSISRADMVFTEPDYHRLTEAVFHWSLSEVVERLRKSTVLFVGLSMSDPSLRRLLDASRNSDIPPHWQIQKRHEVRQDEVLEVMQEIERRARKYAELLQSGLNQQSRPNQLEETLHATLRQADTYDRQVFESMGVKTIWVERFDDIPAVIDAISR